MAHKVSAPDINGNVYEIDTSELRWRPSAYGIIIKNGAILTSPQINGYDLPGGGIDLGEMPEVGLLREIKEETGIDAANPRIVGCGSGFFVLPESAKGRKVQSILLYYVCDYVGGELSDAGFDDYEKALSKFPEWLPLSEVDSITVGSSYDWRPFVKQVIGA